MQKHTMIADEIPVCIAAPGKVVRVLALRALPYAIDRT